MEGGQETHGLNSGAMTSFVGDWNRGEVELWRWKEGWLFECQFELWSVETCAGPRHESAIIITFN